MFNVSLTKTEKRTYGNLSSVPKNHAKMKKISGG